MKLVVLLLSQTLLEVLSIIMEASAFSLELVIGVLVAVTLSVSLYFVIVPVLQIKKKKTKVEGNSQIVDGKQNISVNGVNGDVTINTNSDKSEEVRESGAIDYNVYILFIDDEPDSEEDMKRIKSLSSYGYTNVHLIKDGTVTSPEVVSAQFVFVDITGVGKAAGCNEGTELAVQIKKKYGEQKIVAIYSSTETHNIQVKGLQSLDYIFGKNDDTQVYLDFIEQYAKRN